MFTVRIIYYSFPLIVFSLIRHEHSVCWQFFIWHHFSIQNPPLVWGDDIKNSLCTVTWHIGDLSLQRVAWQDASETGFPTTANANAASACTGIWISNLLTFSFVSTTTITQYRLSYEQILAIQSPVSMELLKNSIINLQSSLPCTLPKHWGSRSLTSTNHFKTVFLKQCDTFTHQQAGLLSFLWLDSSRCNTAFKLKSIMTLQSRSLVKKKKTTPNTWI